VCRRLVDHFLSLTMDRESAEQLVRSACGLHVEDTVPPEEIIEVSEHRRESDGRPVHHRELTLTLRSPHPEYLDRELCVFRGLLWQCIFDGREVMLLR
jgi:hypothetical protein